MRFFSLLFISLAAGFIFATPANATPEEAYQACTQGNLDGCRFAVEHSRGRDYELYRNALSNGCMMGDRMFCGEGHFTFKREDSPHFDLVQAGNFALVGCQNDLIDMCFHAGMFYTSGMWTGSTPEQNAQYAKPALIKACDGTPDGRFFKRDDRQNACISLVNTFYDLNQPVTIETQIAYISGCDAGLGYMCSMAAKHHMEGAGDIPRVLEAANTYYERACDLGEHRSCALRGSNAYFHEDDANKALSFAGPACLADDDTYNCQLATTLGYYATEVEGINKMAIYARGCNEMQIVEACEALTDEANARGDIPGMKRHGRKACNLGSEYGCEMLTIVANAEAKSQAEHAQYLAEASRQFQTRIAEQNARATQSFAAASHAYWTNWKPSYCADYTRAGFTSKYECAD